MRKAAALTLAALFTSTPLLAQESDADASVERIRRALQAPPQIVLGRETPPVSIGPGVKTFGIFTLATPQSDGEMVRVVVPVGELVMRAVSGVARAQHRRAERKARQEVLRALADFQSQQAR